MKLSSRLLSSGLGVLLFASSAVALAQGGDQPKPEDPVAPAAGEPAAEGAPAPDEQPTAVDAKAEAQPEVSPDAEVVTATTVAEPAVANTQSQAATAPPEEEKSWKERARSFFQDDMWPVGKQILLALLLFLGGWIVAKFVSWLLFRLLCKTSLDDILVEKLGIKYLIQGEDSPPNSVERFLAKGVFYLLMLLVVVAVLQYAGLSQAAEPIQSFVDRIAESLPLLGKAVLILIVAYFAGLILQKIVSKAIDAAKLDAKFAELSTPKTKKADATADGEAPEERKFSENAGRVMFWLVMVGGLAGAVDALEIGPLAHAMRNVVDRIVSLLPSVAIAGALVVAGYVFGRIARTIIDNVLDTAGLNRLVEKVKLDKLFGKTRASDVAGLAAQVFIGLQVVIAALNELKLETLSVPLTDMMGQFWYFLPIVALSILIVIAGVIAARLVRNLLEVTLKNLGFDDLMGKLGFGEMKRGDEVMYPREFVGLLAQVGIILIATVQALQNVQLFTWSGYVDGFIQYSVTHVAVAMVIVAVAMAVGNYVRDLIASRKRDEDDDTIGWIASFARYAVMVFGFTMAIHHLNVGPNFVLISFSLLFGGLCLALALALGLGGREVAGEFLRRHYDKARRELQSRKTTKPPAKPTAAPAAQEKDT